MKKISDKNQWYDLCTYQLHMVSNEKYHVYKIYLSNF